MKIKVGDKIYDGDKEPVMVILSEADKKNIAQMSHTATKYCSYPDTPEWTKEKIDVWMKDTKPTSRDIIEQIADHNTRVMEQRIKKMLDEE